jgi:hypothetical protein
MASRWSRLVRRARPTAPVAPAAPVAEPPVRPRWAVGPLVAEPSDDGWSGVVAVVDGTPLRFAARGARLSTRPESVLSYFTPQALVAGVDLVAPSPVDGAWRTGARTAAARLAPWLDVDGPVPDVIVDEGSSEAAPVAAPASGRVGLCFTSGVDSFWSLLRGGYDPTDLVYVWGYDVGLDDRARFDDLARSLEAVAAAGGHGLALVRTDARQHPHNRHVLWGFHHGAALAAAGILLSDDLDRLVIPPSYPDGALIPWGSRPDLDPLWSIPGAVEIVHASTPRDRYARIIDIAEEPLVHQHLRVCWEYLEPGANCGRCEKCVRTMVMFAGAGTLDRLETFPTAGDLPAAVAALSPLPPHSVSFWQVLVDDRVPPPLRSAVERLVTESEG